jgi:predicted RecB family nuclease
MNISSDLFESFLKCPTKCWLRFTGAPTTGNAYAEWVQTQNESYRADAAKRLIAEDHTNKCDVAPVVKNLKTAKSRAAVDVIAQTPESEPGSRRGNVAHTSTSEISQNLMSAPTNDQAGPNWISESRLHTVECIPSEGRGKPAQFVPVHFVFRNKLTKDDKWVLAFDAFVFSETIGRAVSLGKIIHGDDHVTLKVKTSALATEVRKRIETISAVLSSPSPPDLVLNRHCAECEFQSRCRKIAVEKDDLSLLAGMSAKERKKLRSKGIFTVTQLSYMFRPRRRSKRRRDRREKYHHSLKALAIREKKIHIVGSPELKIEGTPVYLDVEGLPDRDFYYLIGVRIGNGDSAVQHSLWADTIEDEGKIWREFLAVLESVEKPVLIHYGSYETTFLKEMQKRHGGFRDDSVAAIRSATNLISIIFSKIYFPTFSNGLKEIARHLGFDWSVPSASGTQTIVWRETWSHCGEPSDRQKIISYNADDCAALCVVAQGVLGLQPAPSGLRGAVERDVVDTTTLKREHPYGFKRNTFFSPELDAINKAAYWDYQRDRVFVKSSAGLGRRSSRTSSPRQVLAPNKTIVCPRPRNCPKCASAKFFKHTKYTKTLCDLKFMGHGIKRWITSYRFHRYQCQTCRTVFQPEETCWGKGKFGSEIMAYALYLNIELRVPQLHVASNLNRLLGFHLDAAKIGSFKAGAAENYKGAYNLLVNRLCSGRLLHVDETKIDVKDNDGFVWVFANMEEVAYVYGETREGDLLHNMLKNFKGVLVSDFYAAYDAIQCPQQKCLIHLIRDMNDDLLKCPYDEELKRLAQAFTTLLKPMVETIGRYGLKSRFLGKHLAAVNRFYREIFAMPLHNEIAAKLKDRLEKNRDKLFTFLRFDGVPWNNNNAEHAVKPFAALRRIIGGVTTEKGLRDYLILLSLCETCKYMGLDFLDFLRSGEKDIHTFAKSRQGRRRRLGPKPVFQTVGYPIAEYAIEERAGEPQ